jgi:hypothetical protein
MHNRSLLLEWRQRWNRSLFDATTVAVTDYEGGTRWLAGQRGGGGCLTDDESEVSIRRAVELGISGYLPLSSRVEAVVHAVRCIHNGGTAIALVSEKSMATSGSGQRGAGSPQNFAEQQR